MRAPRDLDYAPLTERSTLAQRGRVLVGSPAMLIGTTLIVLVLLVPLAALVFIAVSVIADGTRVGASAVFAILFFLVAGVLGALDVWGRTDQSAGLARFAEVNGLQHHAGVMAPGYAGSLFADGSHQVQESVRTPGRDFVEVGNRYRSDPVTLANRREIRASELFLRARLGDGVADSFHARAVVPPGVSARLDQLAGEHTVEVSGFEVTVFGARPLDVDDPAALAEAFELIDELAAANARTEPLRVAAPQPAMDESGRPHRPWLVVLAVLFMVIVVPLVFAVVMSTAVDAIGGPSPAGGIVALAGIAVLLAVASAIVRFLLRPSRRQR